MGCFIRATGLTGKHRQEFWCHECDGVKVDSEKPETGSFFFTSGHEWRGIDNGGVVSNFHMVVFALCFQCLPKFNLGIKWG